VVFVVVLFQKLIVLVIKSLRVVLLPYINMLWKINCSFDPIFDYREYNEPKHHESYLFNLIFKFNFLLCTYFQSVNDETKGNFVHILKYQKEKRFCSKYYITGFYTENKLWEIKFQNENTERKFFNLDNVLPDIEEEIVLLNQLFPDILNDPLKEKIPKETIVYQIYQETIQILKNSKGKVEQKHGQDPLMRLKEIGNQQKFENPENISSFFGNEKDEVKKTEDHNRVKEKASNTGEKKTQRQIKVKGKILNVPGIWVKYKIKNWNDFTTHVKNDIEDFLSTENINPKILEDALENIKLSSFIMDEKDLDFGEVNYANFFGRAIDGVWDFIRVNREKTIKIKNKEFKIPSSWDEYNINDFSSFQEIVKAGMLRQFAKTKKLTPTLIKVVEETNLENSIALEEELDLNSEEHVHFVKRKMLTALVISNEQ